MTPSRHRTTPPISAGPPCRITPNTSATTPPAIANSETGRPPNGLGGRSPYAPSGLVRPGTERGRAGRPSRGSGRRRSCLSRGRSVGELAEQSGDHEHRLLGDVNRVVANPLEAAGD